MTLGHQTIPASWSNSSESIIIIIIISSIGIPMPPSTSFLISYLTILPIKSVLTLDDKRFAPRVTVILKQISTYDIKGSLDLPTSASSRSNQRKTTWLPSKLSATDNKWRSPVSTLQPPPEKERERGDGRTKITHPQRLHIKVLHAVS